MGAWEDAERCHLCLSLAVDTEDTEGDILGNICWSLLIQAQWEMMSWGGFILVRCRWWKNTSVIMVAVVKTIDIEKRHSNWSSNSRIYLKKMGFSHQSHSPSAVFSAELIHQFCQSSIGGISSNVNNSKRFSSWLRRLWKPLKNCIERPPWVDRSWTFHFWNIMSYLFLIAVLQYFTTSDLNQKGHKDFLLLLLRYSFICFGVQGSTQEI